MGIGSQIVCDAPNCGKVKQESNHWFTCYIVVDGSEIKSPEEFRCIRGVYADIVAVKFACGQQCQHKLFDKFLTTGEL